MITKGRNGKKIISLASFGARKPLDRLRTINFILQYMPDVQIHLTTNGKGEYEASIDVKEKGMIVCPDCGHIQAVEIIICKNCTQFITI